MTQMSPGDFYLTRISGATGVFITLSQWLIGDLSRYSHAGIYLGEIDGVEMVAEAMPGGLQINPLSNYHGKELVHSNFQLPYEVEEDIVSLARQKEGLPYSYLGYLYLGLTSFNHCPQWIKDKVSSSDALFCSQFVDYIYTECGVHLFEDDRLYLDVTPGDLARLIAEQ